MKNNTIELIKNEETLYKNLIHYENLIKHFAYRYLCSEEEAKAMVDYLRRGLI